MKYITDTVLTLCIILGMAVPSLAQTTVSGTVTDAETGQTMPGVNISVKGTTTGTATGTDGTYSLSVPSQQDTLVFSFVGYTTKVVPVAGRTTINVELSPQTFQGQELVVVGYGTQEVEDNTGSISSISASEFNEGAITSPQELFQGKAAGVTVTSNDGAPGSGATIRIRGGSSLAASNDPLFVIDGVPLEGGGIAGMRNPLNTINPNDIASISILKDASATAIYGSRASNGVVLITTKRGVEGQDLSVSYNASLSYQTRPHEIDMLSADEFRTVVAEHFGSAYTDLLGEENTDWQDQIYDEAVSQNHNLSFTGAYGGLPYRLSLGFAGNSGLLRTSDMDRLTGSLALNPTFFDDQLKVDLNIKGMRVANRFANRGAIGSALAFDPTQPVTLGPSAPYGGYFTWIDQNGNPISIAPANPVALLEQTTDKSTVYRSIGNAKFEYMMPFVSNLSATLNLGYDYSDVQDGIYLVPANAAFEYQGDGAPNGVRSTYNQRRENELLDFYLNYNKELPSIESTLDLTGGYSWEHHYERGSNLSTNYNLDVAQDTTANTEYETEHYIVSFFGRMNYTLRDKYLLTATLRQDGTSRFSEENRWGLFPSVALAWKMHQEPFLENAGALSQLKFRLGYGITGQQRIGQGNYPYLPQYTYSEPTARYQFGNEFITTLRPEGYNEDLKWEETTTYNIGLDYGFFEERLTGSIDAYYRETTDLLNVIPVPAGTNFTNRILSNVGTMEVKGIEFNVTGRVISTEDTYWQVAFNASHNVNEITKLTTVDSEDYIGVETGGISGGVGNTIQIHSVGFPRNAFFVFEQVYDENGNPIEGVYVDRNNDGSITEADKYRYQDPSPDYTLGFSSRLEYQNWDASFSARANLGNYVYNNVASNNTVYSFMYNSQGYLVNALDDIREVNFNNAQYMSDHYVENASFLRLDNVTLGYTFNNLFNAGTSLRASATVQNVFVLTNYSGLDPELFGGIDNNVYPRPRSFILGVNINF